MNESRVVLFCGPSGSGKTTIVKHLLNKFSLLCFSVSATTRNKRVNEKDGEDYYFLSIQEFRKKIEQQEFLEWEEVYKNGFYGTLKSEITRISNEGKVAIFDVDVVGGLAIKSQFHKNILDVIVLPPSVDELRNRLVARESESPESLKIRLDKASHEMTFQNKFSNVIINSQLDIALSEAENLVAKFINRIKG